MGREQIEAAWSALEKGADLQTSLEALDILEEWVAPENEEAMERLRKLSRRASGALSTAFDRALLRFRRRSNDWEILTQSVSTSPEDEHRLARALREAKEILHDPDPVVRLHFVDDCARRERFETGPALATHALLEKDPRVLAATARALGKLGSGASVVCLKAISRHASAEVRRGSVEGLAYQRGRSALQLLVERLGDPEKEVLWATIDLLEALPLSPTLEILEAIPLGKLAEVRVGAVRFLKGFLREPRTLALLRSWLEDRHPRLSAESLVALASIRDPAAESRFQQLAVDPDPRAQQVLTLARMAYEAAE